MYKTHREWEPIEMPRRRNGRGGRIGEKVQPENGGKRNRRSRGAWLDRNRDLRGVSKTGDQHINSILGMVGERCATLSHSDPISSSGGLS